MISNMAEHWVVCIAGALNFAAGVVALLLGAQINAPTRQAAIKSALLHLLAQEEKAAQPAA